jgi:hypothetical protein
VAGTIRGAWSAAMASVREQAQTTWQRVQDTWGGAGGAGVPEGGGLGTRTMAQKAPPAKAAAAGPKEAAAPSRIGQWEAELAEIKARYQRENDLRELAKGKELEYWQEIAAATTLTAQERIAVAKRTAEAELAILREESATRKGLNAEAIAERERAGLAALAMARLESRALLDDDKITKAQQLEQEQQFAQQELEIHRAAVAARMEALKDDPTKNAVALAQLQDQMLQLEREYNLKRRELEVQQQRESQFSWKGLFDSIGSNFAQSIQGMLRGTTSLVQGLRSLFGSLLNTIVGFLTQWAAKWAATQLANLVLDKTVKGSEVASAVALAGANGVASWAGAPWPINLGAPAFGAQMAATAASFGVVAAAERGFDIPAGVNPVTQLHAREMVLPAAIADPLREQLAGGGMGGGTVVYNDHSGRLTQAQIRENAYTIARELNRLGRLNFQPA